MTAAIRLDDLTKRYGSIVAVEGLSLEVAPGEGFGFIGPNGAGKTTTIRLLLDLIRPTRGRASVFGFDCRSQGLEVRRRVGYLPGDMPMYPDLDGEGYLAFLARLGVRRWPRERLAALLDRFEVSGRDLHRRMGDLSHGTKRKFGIIQALIGDPPVLIVDEPTAGLDPLMIEAFLETIAEHRARGATVFLSSHILAQVEQACDRIGLIRAGRVVTVRSIAELRQQSPRRVTVEFRQPLDAATRLPEGAILVTREPSRWVIDVRGPLGSLVAALATLPVHDIHVVPFSLEDYVLQLYDDPGPAKAGHHD